MRATSYACGIVAGDENGLVASTTNMTSAFRSPCFASATVPSNSMVATLPTL